jgi:hypothetical protein
VERASDKEIKVPTIAEKDGMIKKDFCNKGVVGNED